MISNKTKRNIWLAVSVVCFLNVIGAAIALAFGSALWWQLTGTAIIFGLCFKLYLAYRAQVKQGNLFGKFYPMRKS